MISDDVTPSNARGVRITCAVAGAIPAVFGLMSLLGWLLDFPRLASFGPDLMPMAPSTAVLFLLHGFVLAMHARSGLGRVGLWLTQGAGALAAGVVLLLVGLTAFNVHPTAEHLGFAIDGEIQGAAIGYISPITAAWFLLASLASLLAPSPRSAFRLRRRSLAFGSAALLLGTALVFLLAYLYGEPLLYGGGFIPPALNTVVAFVVLSVGILVHVGRRSVSTATLPSRAGAVGMFLAGFALLTAAMVTAGYLYYRGYEREYRAEIERQLLAVADLKVGELSQWRGERLADGAIFSGSANLAHLVQQSLGTPAGTAAAARLGTWLRQVQSANQYDRVALFDAHGVELASAPGTPEPTTPQMMASIEEALGTGGVTIRDFYRDTSAGSIRLAVLVPLFDPDTARPLAVLLLRVDPANYLYPFIRRWPTPSRTAETLLVRRDGDDALFLNELRFKEDAALSLRIPLAKTQTPAVQAALGRHGIVDGVDYRGAPVLAAVRPVPDSPWSLVARMDVEEVYAPVRARLWEMVLLVAALIVGLGAGLGLLWHRRSAQFYHERYHAAEALRLSESRYRTTLSSVGDAVISTDAQGRVDFMNPMAERLTGWSENEGRRRPLNDVFCIINEETRAEAENPVERVLREGSLVGLANHTLLIAKDGTQWPIANSGAPIHDERDVIAGVVLIFRDQTEERRAQRALGASETRYRRLFEAAKDGILILDASTGKIVDVNPFLTELTGYSRDDFLGAYLWEIGPFKDTDNSKEAFAKLLTEKYVRYDDLPLQARDGRKIPVEFVSNVYRVDDQNVIQCNIRDITERKRADSAREKLEEQLRVSQKMEAIGSLAGGVAHDFNNLLSVILSYTGFVLEGVREGDPQRDDLLEVKKAADRAVALTRQLLAFSRKQVLQPVSMSLNQIATGVEKMLRRILGEDIDFVQALAPDLGVVQADPGQIEQVLMNLVINARDAMPEGGALTIETSNVEIDEEYATTHVAVKPGSYVQLAVTDTGCGMDEQTRARLFEPFFTTKEKGKGTGLGLSTVYGIVKQSGGNVWVYSELGQGTTFKIYLPRELSATTAMAIKPSTAPMRSTGTETILVVEDEEALRKVAKRGLEGAGYRVLTASDGHDALLVSAQHAGDIHLLLTDVVMPRMSGRAVAQELLKTRPTLKVVYMSGYTDDAIVHHGVLDAGTPFLAKPFTSADLTRKAREVLDSGIKNLADGHEQPFKDEAEKKEQPLDQAALRHLPPDVRASLRKAVIAARYNEIVTIIEMIRVTEPNVATKLRRMTDLFDYDGMRDLLSDKTESQRGR